MVDRRLLKNFDWGILIAAILLSLIGIATIYSATRPVLDVEQQSFYLKQLYWMGFSLLCFFIVTSVDYRFFIKFAHLFLIAGIILLLSVLVIGKKGMGAHRWISLGFLSFQPSEFFKLFFVISLSRYLSDGRQEVSLGLKELTKLIAIFLILPFILILKQPDLGTAIILLLIFFSMIMMAGMKRKIVLVTVIVSLISLPFIGSIMWENLKGYQRQRIIAFVEPKSDPHGAGYHITQSKVSIGSGGFLGKGYQKGTQGPLRFLPERHTDFVFSIFAEEWGFVGSIVLFGIYLFLILRGFDTARKARDLSGSFLVLGVTLMFSFYFIVNVGMTLGMVPVVGIPLPLVSYGGTAMLSNFLAIGIIENVRMRRSFACY